MTIPKPKRDRNIETVTDVGNVSVQEYTEHIQSLINAGKNLIEDFNTGKISDGYHTFDELYEFRKMYNAILFNTWAEVKQKSEYSESGYVFDTYPSVHKSWKHHDGEWCFGEEKQWFIVVAMLPTGQISNYYKAEDWDLFQIPETETALYPFDGHTPNDVLQRLKDLI